MFSVDIVFRESLLRFIRKREAEDPKISFSSVLNSSILSPQKLGEILAPIKKSECYLVPRRAHEYGGWTYLIDVLKLSLIEADFQKNIVRYVGRPEAFLQQAC